VQQSVLERTLPADVYGSGNRFVNIISEGNVIRNWEFSERNMKKRKNVGFGEEERERDCRARANEPEQSRNNLAE
jgi:hypothetical protein